MKSQRIHYIDDDRPIDYRLLAIFALSVAATFGLWGWTIIEATY